MTGADVGVAERVAVVADEAGPGQRRRGWRRRGATRGKWIVGGSLVGFVVILALGAPLWAPHSPTAPNPLVALQAPSAQHIFGTDVLGYDVFSRVLYGLRVDLVISGVSVALAFLIGVPLGAWIGYHGGSRGARGVFAAAWMRLFDLLQAFPVFVLALALAATLGRNSRSVVYVLIIMSVPVFARFTRSAVQSVRKNPYIEAARVGGAKEHQVIFRHVLPNAIGAPLVAVSILAGGSILMTAGLSFIGAGVQPPTPELGEMIASGAQNIITGQWWPSIFPGLFIALAVFGFALLGDALDDRLSRRDQ